MKDPLTGNPSSTPAASYSPSFPSPPSPPADSLLFRMIGTAVTRPFTILTISIAICFLGAVSFLYLRIEYMPALSVPVVHVVTEYPGFPAADVERLLTIPLENGLSAVKGVRRMESVTKDGVSTISLQFDWRVDLRSVTVDIREKIDSTYPYLPFGIQKPLVYTEDLNADPLLVLSVTPAEGRTLKDITPLIRKELSSRLLRIKGVSSLRMVGTSEPEILVEGKKGPIQAGFLSLDELVATLKAHVFQSSLGPLLEGEQEFLVEADTGVDSVEALADLCLPTHTGGGGSGGANGSGSGSGMRYGAGSSVSGQGFTGPFGGVQKLRDVATISLREKERTSFFHWNGREAIGIFLHRMPDASTLRTAKDVLNTLPSLNNLFQKEFRIEVIQDSTHRIRASLTSLLGSIGMGIGAVFLVLALTFKNLVAPLLISVSIPLSTLGVFFAMYLARISLNTVSLSGIALGIGMIVDNSIVVLETLNRQKARGIREICQAVIDVFPSLFSSTLTTVLVFLPIALIPGVLGALFKELSLTISILLGLSLGTSLFFTPVLYVLFFSSCIFPPNTGGAHGESETEGKDRQSEVKRGKDRRGSLFQKKFPQEKPCQGIWGIYQIFLLYTFRHPILPLGGSILFVIVGALSFFLIPKRVLPEATPDALQVSLSYPAGTPLDKSSRQTLRVEQKILTLKGVLGVFAEAGYEARSLKDRGTPDRNPWTVRLSVQIEGNEAHHLRTELSHLLAGEAGIEYRVEVPADGTSRLIGATDTLRFHVQGPVRDDLITQVENLFHQAGVPSLFNSAVPDTRKNLPQKTFEVKDDLALFHGITPRYILNALEQSVRGTVVTTLPLQGEDVDIRIRLDRELSSEDPATETSSIVKVPLPLRGGVIDTGMVGTVQSSLTYPELHRTDRKPSVTWTFYPREGKQNELEALLESKTRILEREGLSAVLVSRSALAEQGVHVLQVFLTALILMYLVLGAQFESFGIPLLLLVSFPLSIVGSLLCLYFLGFSLNLHSFLGILVLLGTIINGTILLTGAYAGKDENGILEETVTHIRPLLATVSTTLVALLPLLLGGTGNVQAHTALSLGGGLVLGTAGILAVYPGLYRIFCLRNFCREHPSSPAQTHHLPEPSPIHAKNGPTSDPGSRHLTNPGCQI